MTMLSSLRRLMLKRKCADSATSRIILPTSGEIWELKSYPANKVEVISVAPDSPLITYNVVWFNFSHNMRAGPFALTMERFIALYQPDTTCAQTRLGSSFSKICSLCRRCFFIDAVNLSIEERWRKMKCFVLRLRNGFMNLRRR